MHTRRAQARSKLIFVFVFQSYIPLLSAAPIRHVTFSLFLSFLIFKNGWLFFVWFGLRQGGSHHTAPASLELFLETRLASEIRWPWLLSAEIKDVCHRAWPYM